MIHKISNKDTNTLGEGLEKNTYLVCQNITDMLGIDRVEGSFCIKALDGNEQYLGGVDLFKIVEYQRASNNPGEWSKDFSLEKYKMQLFNGFDPEKPLKVVIDYPLSEEVPFEILQYHEKVNDKTFPCFPVGYVAWSIAKEYEKVYKDPERFGIWGHSIEDLRLDSILLYENNRIEIKISS